MFTLEQKKDSVGSPKPVSGTTSGHERGERMSGLQVDQVLMDAVIEGTIQGLEMTGVNPPPVGATRFFSATRPIAVIVGLAGKNNGTVTLNLTERGMLHLASRLMMEDVTEPSEEVFDGIMEIGNMVAGRIKEKLIGSKYEIERISVPSLVLGASYDVYYTRGIKIVSVEFENQEISSAHHKDRFFSCTVSMLRQLA